MTLELEHICTFYRDSSTAALSRISCIVRSEDCYSRSQLLHLHHTSVCTEKCSWDIVLPSYLLLDCMLEICAFGLDLLFSITCIDELDMLISESKI